MDGMRFASDEQRKAVMAKMRQGQPHSSRRVIAPGKARQRGSKRMPMKQPPEDWLAQATHNIKQARRALKDGQTTKSHASVRAAYRNGWENAYGSVEKSIKAAAPFKTADLVPAYDRTHNLVKPLVELQPRYPEITGSMIEGARWMEEDVGHEAKYPNGKHVGEGDVRRAITFAAKLEPIIRKDPRRGL